MEEREDISQLFVAGHLRKELALIEQRLRLGDFEGDAILGAILAITDHRCARCDGGSATTPAIQRIPLRLNRNGDAVEANRHQLNAS